MNNVWPVVIIACFAAGLLLILQSSHLLIMSDDQNLSGLFIGLGGVRELFPLFACLAFASIINTSLIGKDRPMPKQLSLVVYYMIMSLAVVTVGAVLGTSGGLLGGLLQDSILWPRFASFVISGIAVSSIMTAATKALAFGLVFGLATIFELHLQQRQGSEYSAINMIVRPMLAGGGTHLLVTWFLY